MIQIEGTKNREETLGLIAKTWQSSGIGAMIEIMQLNDRGGKTLEKTLRIHFPQAICDSRQKARFITLSRTEDTPSIIDIWLSYTQLQLVESTGFYSMPGLFGWNKVDKGSKLLINTIPTLKGFGADFGCGYGYLSKNSLCKFNDIEKLYGFDIDPRAVEASKKNVTDTRALFSTKDCTQTIPDLPVLDFIIMNPPFHDNTSEDRTMGQKFIEIAANHLRKNGHLWIVANTHMPYEKILSKAFKFFEIVTQDNGFKILKAIK